MPTNNYPDGFPMTSLEAVNFSYFLSEEEKQDWRQWLGTASPQQQKELVDTLHAMWEENQKEVVPTGFNSATVDPFSSNLNSTAGETKIQTPVADFPSPIQNSQTVEQNLAPQIEQPEDTGFGSFKMFDANEMASSNIEPEPVPEIKQIPETAVPRDTTPAKMTAAETETQNNDNLMNFGNSKYTANPILENESPNPSEFSYQNKASKQQPDQNQRNDKNKNIQKNQSSNSNQQNNSNPQQPSSKPFFNVAKVREAATRTALEDIYNQYLTSREKSFSSDREYQENHGMFLDKVMQVVVNFEQVADYFESMTQKLLEMNDRMVKQAKDFQDLKSTTQTKQTDIQDQIDELRRDADRLFRETKDIRADYRRRYDEIGEQMAAYGADAYRQDGILQRLDLLMAKVHKLEQVSKETGKVESISIADRLRNTVNSNQTSTKPQAGNDDTSNNPNIAPKPDRKQSIDLRNVI